ncbi:unnamed protein product [Effrenium voratum]|nr:unnamed protein product [Effrenium voratum]
MDSVRWLLAHLRDAGRPMVPLSTAQVGGQLQSLRTYVAGLPVQPPDDGCRRRVKVVGDPMIIDADGTTHHYWGPAVLVNFNGAGVVTALEFVDTHRDRNYISEVWRYELHSRRYKYRFLEEEGVERVCTRGRGALEGPEYVAGDGSWSSERGDGEVPTEWFLQKFKASARTFFINCSTGTFVEGPPFCAIKSFWDKPTELCAQIFASMEVEPAEWMRKSLDIISSMSGWHHKEEKKGRANSRDAQDVLDVLTVHFACGLAAAVSMPNDRHGAAIQV